MWRWPKWIGWFIDKEPDVFKRIEIQLKHSFCPCERNERKWRWFLEADNAGGVSLTLTCHKCDTRLVVPHRLFIAGFQVDDDTALELCESKAAPLPDPEENVLEQQKETDQ